MNLVVTNLINWGYGVWVYLVISLFNHSQKIFSISKWTWNYSKRPITQFPDLIMPNWKYQLIQILIIMSQREKINTLNANTALLRNIMRHNTLRYHWLDVSSSSSNCELVGLFLIFSFLYHNKLTHWWKSTRLLLWTFQSS